MLYKLEGYDAKVEAYYRRRCQRSLNDSADGHATLSFDCSSIGPNSQTIRSPASAQFNYMAVCEQATGDIVYAGMVEGSLDDNAVLPA